MLSAGVLLLMLVTARALVSSGGKAFPLRSALVSRRFQSEWDDVFPTGGGEGAAAAPRETRPPAKKFQRKPERAVEGNEWGDTPSSDSRGPPSAQGQWSSRRPPPARSDGPRPARSDAPRPAAGGRFSGGGGDSFARRGSPAAGSSFAPRQRSGPSSYRDGDRAPRDGYRPQSYPDRSPRDRGTFGAGRPADKFRSDRAPSYGDGSQSAQTSLGAVPSWDEEATMPESHEPVYGYFEGDHLYGVSPVHTAISSGRRNVTELIMQAGMDLADKKDEKLALQIVQIARDKGIPIREFSKHDLNMMADNRPHQGFILRAEPLDFVKVEELGPASEFKCVLALDEVWDPQNFGALLRTAYFLAVDRVVVCAKNSAPLSPVVSKASSGAMEVMEIGSTSNMMRFLDRSRANGWQVVGTSLSDTSIPLMDATFDKPTILVLGNEGYGMRTNIVTRCDMLVKIPGLVETGTCVDSLNVSVTGGILMYSILGKSAAKPAA